MIEKFYEQILEIKEIQVEQVEIKGNK